MAALEDGGHIQREELAGFLYGEPEPGRRQQVAGHLAACAQCRAEAARWEAVRTELRGWKLPQGTRRAWRKTTPA